MKIFSKRSHEGYICIDHKESPGFTDQDAKTVARVSLMPFLGRGKKFEAATDTCAHCIAGKVVIRNPLRTRPRGHCTKCDHFICDPCQADFYLTSQCRCWASRLDARMKGVA